MTWVAWRQQRALLFVLAALVTTGALGLAYLGVEMGNFITSRGLTGCVLNADCSAPGDGVQKFIERYASLLELAKLVMLGVPVLAGMFLGGPLFAREFENRTHLLALGQAVSLRRWTVTKIAVATVPALVGVGVLTYVFHRMVDTGGAMLLGQESLFSSTFFDAQGLMPVLYTLFAVLTGAAFGLLLRSTVGALAATLAVFTAGRIALQLIRDHLLPPTLLRGSIGSADAPFPALPEGSKLVESGYVSKTGAVVSEDALPTACTQIGAGPQPVDGAPTGTMTDVIECLRAEGFTGTAQYFHGPDHYWVLQLIEGGILVAVASLLLGVSVWRLRTRLR